jgi:hypothetical protein
MRSPRVLAAIFVALLAFASSQAACSSSSSHKDAQKGPTTPTETSSVTFAETIEPLVQEKCQGCHHDGGIAPFSLVTYDEVKTKGALARGMVQARQMPPWGAFNDDACNVNYKFKDDLTLSDAEIDQFVTWVDNGMPLGDESKRPPARTAFSSSDLVDKTGTYSALKPYTVAPGKDTIRCFPIDPGITEDTWIDKSNVVPGDPRIVHHVIVYVDPKQEGAPKADETGSYPCFGGPDLSGLPTILLAWAPGVPPTSYGDHAGLKIPKNAHLVMQVHYHPNDETIEDKTVVELKKLDAKPEYVAQVIVAGNATKADGIIQLLPGPDDPPSGPEFLIPSNVKDHTESMALVIPPLLGFDKVGLYGVGAHMHWAGVDMKIDIKRANPQNGEPKTECLLGTPKYDFNWQRGYVYDAPFEKLPTASVGDTITMTCTYDNTPSNKYIQREMAEERMSVPPEIHLGETTRDEMCLGVFVAVRKATSDD